ncbi:MAG TPA: hypothetical protein DFH96_07420 [Bacteroidetes bacterium]|nr:hypothetical protein [Bacteroidota bacterium]
MCQEKKNKRANCCRVFNRQLQLRGNLDKSMVFHFATFAIGCWNIREENQHGVKKRKRQKETGMKVPAAIH